MWPSVPARQRNFVLTRCAAAGSLHSGPLLPATKPLPSCLPAEPRWAVAKLHATEHPASVEMVGALENALIACLAGPSDATKLNAQGASSVW